MSGNERYRNSMADKTTEFKIHLMNIVAYEHARKDKSIKHTITNFFLSKETIKEQHIKRAKELYDKCSIDCSDEWKNNNN